jgi:peptidyl-prolyl cis-trans isomerase D
MLQTIRERLTGWFAIFLLGAIALTLVATFGNIDTGFTAGGVAATVNGDDIGLRDFRRLYNRQRQQWESNFRTQIPDELSQQMADQVIESLVRNRAVAQHVREQGYRVTDDEIVAIIESTPAFQVGGRFSRPQYESLLAMEGISPQRFEFEQRQDMEVSQFLEGLGRTAFYTPAEFRRYIELDGERRNIEYVLLPASNWLGEVEVTEDEISSFYELNRLNYMTEESVDLVYIEVDYNRILESVSVTEEEVRAYYDANPQEFGGPEERKASHILIAAGEDDAAAAAQAESLRGRIDAGEDFAALAAEFSADTGSASNAGDLGWLGIGDAPAPEFEEALFALAEGEISPPVKTQFGYHIIRLDGLRDGDVREFADVQAELTEQLRENAAADAFAEAVDELDESALESLDGLAPVAEQLGLELGRADKFTRNGGLPLGFSPGLIDAVFSLEVLEDGENSPVIDLGEGRAAVVQVVEYRPSEVQPLEEVKSRIAAQLRQEKSVALAAAAGGEVLAALKSGASPELPEGIEWQTATDVRRGNQELPVNLTAAVFRAPKPPGEEAQVPGPYQGLPLATGDFAIFRLTSYISGNPLLYSEEDRDLRKQQLAARLGASQATAMVEMLVEDASVSVTPNLLDTDNL